MLVMLAVAMLCMWILFFGGVPFVTEFCDSLAAGFSVTTPLEDRRPPSSPSLTSITGAVVGFMLGAAVSIGGPIGSVWLVVYLWRKFT